MRYYLFKMKFLTSLHIGESSSARSLETSQMTFCADTLFSALCKTAIEMGGLDYLKKLYNLSKEDRLLFSDAMPYHDEDLYLPKFITLAQKRSDSSILNKKVFKNLKYISLSQVDKYISFLKGESDFLPKDIKFAHKEVSQKVGILGMEETEPYNVGLYTFNDNCGLYFIVAYKDDETLDLLRNLLYPLSATGIGGKVSSGYGYFEIDDEIYLDEICDEQTEKLNIMLNTKDSTSYISLTSALPKEDELEAIVKDSTYTLIRRGGFVSSETYSIRPSKKKTQHFFKTGSLFKKRFSGDIYDVSIQGNHPVYRYAKPIFLGVNL